MLFGNSIDRTAGEIRRLNESRQRLATRALAARQELATLKASGPDAILAEFLAEDPGAITGSTRLRILDLEGSLQDLGQAQYALAGKIRDAVGAWYHAQAEVPRAAARKLRDALDRHNIQASKLLQALETHQGCKYMADVGKQPECSLLDGGRLAPVDQKIPEPVSWRMEREIVRLENEANMLDGQAEARESGGTVMGRSLEELLAIASDATRLVPFAEEIAAWHAVATKSARRASALAGYVPDSETELIYTLTWDAAGAVDVARSEARVGSRPYAPPIRAVVAA